MHPNWPLDQAHKRYVAQVGGLNLNGNCVDFYIRAQAEGETVRYAINPPTKYISVQNACISGGENAVWLTRNLGGNLYNYSDMTGSTLTGIPASGTWSTVFDSGITGAEWGRIGWTAKLCGDASLTISVASSTNGTTFGPSQTVTNGADPSVANGRSCHGTSRAPSARDRRAWRAHPLRRRLRAR